jgi:hypothetical protein
MLCALIDRQNSEAGLDVIPSANDFPRKRRICRAHSEIPKKDQPRILFV